MDQTVTMAQVYTAALFGILMALLGYCLFERERQRQRQVRVVTEGIVNSH